MNKIYKLIWNAREQAYVVTSELARKSGKVVGAKVVTTVIGALALTANVAQAQCVSTSEQNQICTNAAKEVVISDRDRPDGKDIAFIGIPSVDPITSQEGVFDILGLADGQNIIVESERTGQKGSLWGINSGTGETTVYISGDVTSSGNEMIPGDTDTPKFDDAVSITNSEDATNLTVNQTASSSTIKGENIGITTSNSGKGSTNIDVAGTVQAKVGIYADNGQNSKAINISQAETGNIDGSVNGIVVNNQGIEAININISGNVTGKGTGTGSVPVDTDDTIDPMNPNGDIFNTGSGIIAENHENATDINIHQLKESSKIQGTATGISAVNSGTGSTTITTVGTVIADGPEKNGTGISVFNGETANAINITQTTGSIKGKETGIAATNSGKGDTKITTGGDVTGTSGAGIQATNIDWADSGEKRGIAVNQTGGSITGGTDGISAINTTGGAVSIETSGKVAGGTGAGISTNGLPASNSSIILNKGADVSAASGIAIEDGDSNSLVTINSGAKVTGNINLGHGSDILTINNGADITGLTMLDGGNDIDNGKDSSNDQLYLNTNLRGSSTSNSAGDVGIVNWENIHLGQSARLTLTGDLNTQNLNIGSGAEVQLDKIDNSSGKNEVAISGNVNNAGNINLVNDNVGDRLTIQGDYHGEKGSKLLLEVTPEQNNADKLHIGGNASGETAIDLTEVSGLGASTAGTNGIEIVSVDGTANGDIFTLLRDHVDAGAYEYRLQKSEDNKWNLYSEKMQETGTKTTYRREVPLYSVVSAQLHQADSLMLGDMHKRIGATPDERMSWGRVIANRSDIRQNGTANTRSKGNYSGLQVGSDIWSNNGLRIGGYLGYLHGNLDVNGFPAALMVRLVKIVLNLISWVLMVITPEIMVPIWMLYYRVHAIM